ncbi:MAG: SpoIIE family protein phosphatase [Planctomycetota bacterium]|jgi:serine phosphatase RsbU (regulator of sigma subunit)
MENSRDQNSEGKVRGTTMRIGKSEISIHKMESLTTFSVRGEYSKELFRELLRKMPKGGGSAGLEIRRLSGINSTIVGWLEKISRKMQDRGGLLILLDPHEQLLDMLKLTGAFNDFTVASTTEEAASLASSTCIKSIAEHDKGKEKTQRVAQEIVHFKRDLTETERYQRTLETAERRARLLLPGKLPDHPRYGFGSFFKPCERVGGDLYGWFPVDEKRFGLFIADVSGHDVMAYTNLGMLLTALRIRGKNVTSPSKVLKMVNADLAPFMERTVFITLLYGILDPDKNEFLLARAGHNLPIKSQPVSEKPPQPIEMPGLAIGVTTGTAYDAVIKDVPVMLEIGDTVLFYTDGVVEARNEMDHEFSMERVISLVGSSAEKSAQKQIDNIIDEIARFHGDRRQEDDITLLTVKRNS